MLINCVAACAHLTITVYEIQRDVGRKSSIFSYPVAFEAPVRGIPVGIALPRLVRKNQNGLQWHHMVKKIRRYLYSFWRNLRTWQTDGQTPHVDNSRAMHSIARKIVWLFIKRFCSWLYGAVIWLAGSLFTSAVFLACLCCGVWIYMMRSICCRIVSIFSMPFCNLYVKHALNDVTWISESYNISIQ